MESLKSIYRRDDIGFIGESLLFIGLMGLQLICYYFEIGALETISQMGGLLSFVYPLVYTIWNIFENSWESHRLSPKMFSLKNLVLGIHVLVLALCLSTVYYAYKAEKGSTSGINPCITAKACLFQMILRMICLEENKISNIGGPLLAVTIITLGIIGKSKEINPIPISCIIGSVASTIYLLLNGYGIIKRERKEVSMWGKVLKFLVLFYTDILIPYDLGHSESYNLSKFVTNNHSEEEVRL